MAEIENAVEEVEFEEDFDDHELQAIFAASLASVTGRYDCTTRNGGSAEPL